MILSALVLLGLGGDVLDGSKAIEEKSIAEDVAFLARVEMEGRDSPSAGQRRAADYISARFRSFGLLPCEDADEVLARFGVQVADQGEPVPGATSSSEVSYLRPFERGLEAPVVEDCRFTFGGGGAGDESRASYGIDWVPVRGCAGRFKGELLFAGFGIRSKSDRYDDIGGRDLEGRVALIVEGEPRHKRKFDGPELTDSALLWSKLTMLQDEGVEGVVVVRREPALPKGKREAFEPLAFGYRYSNASFVGEAPLRAPRRRPPVVEVTPEFAEKLLGFDVVGWAESVDKSGTAKKVSHEARVVDVKSTLRLQQVRVDNVVGVLPGSDPMLAEEYVVVGAHYDHIGVGVGGRVGPGADDNASGTAGLLALVEALSISRPGRSVLICAFSAEEAGLLGSKALCADPPVVLSSIVAMLNMDMIGRGGASEVAVLGTALNPDLAKVLSRGQKLGKTGVKKLVTDGGVELWARSDHYSFHSAGVPALFFFEGLPISRNADYHTWRDVVSLVDAKKIRNTCKLVHQTLCLLANDDSRPQPSQRRH